MSVNWSTFGARAYLEEYYADVGNENLHLLQSLIRAFARIPAHSTILDFGGGPTLYSLFCAATKAASLHFSEYLERNLIEARAWLHGEPDAFDWTPFIKTVLELEGKPASASHIAQRALLTRQRTTRLLHCDASLMRPLPELPNARYDVIVSNFCTESATNSRAQWQDYMTNMVSLLKPGGRLILSTLKGATSYSVGSATFPAVYILEQDLYDMLTRLGFEPNTIEIASVPADRLSRHYQGLMMTSARQHASASTAAARA
jgi:SAM-dependent methyltransferase